MKETITTPNCIFIYTPPPDINAKVILLNSGGVASIGKWGNGIGVIWVGIRYRSGISSLRIG